MIQILTKVPPMRSDAYTSLGSSSRVTIFLAALCCFVFSILMSFLFNENKATSAPEMVKDNNNSTIKVIARKVVPCGLIARNT